MVTAATYQHQPFYKSAEALDVLMSILTQNLQEAEWTIRAWAVFPNHYHFLANSPESEGGGRSLSRLVSRVHMQAAKAINEQQKMPGRKIWHNYWESLITFERSYLARLRYVHRNPEHHGYLKPAELYRWCSASWFAQSAPRAFVRSVDAFKTDRVQVRDVECTVESE
jgi:putative transposase